MKRILLGAGLLVLRLTAAENQVPAQAAAPPPSAVADEGPLVRKWTPPVYPAEALRAKIGGQVTTRVVVDEVGNVIAARVLTATDAKLAEAAVAAVKTWKFTPGVENSKPGHVCVDVPFEFDAAKGPRSWKPGAALPEHLIPQRAPRTEPVAKMAPAGEYPVAMTARRLPGWATFFCVVRPDGRAQDFRITAAAHPDFVRPALAALDRWEFSAATQGDLRVAAEMRGTVSFDLPGGEGAGVLGANGIVTLDGAAPPPGLVPHKTVDPVYPCDFLLDGQPGSATAEFSVQPDGKIIAMKVVDESRAEFGRALLAALEVSTFSAVSGDGRAGAITLMKRAEFKPPASDQTGSFDGTSGRLVQLAQRGKIAGGAGLDDKLTPIYQVPPGYPSVLLEHGRPTGRAMIEFVIDRDGRCRLPRILSATTEEFGWAAATAVGQWIFKAPRRAGEPTEVKVQIPINFSPPEV